MAQSIDDRRADWVARHVWITLATLLVTLGVGLNWDRLWHLTHPFESFWSPPHVFIYLSSLLTAALVARLALSTPARAVLGWDVRLPALAVPVPGALALAGAGLVLLGIAGAVLDNAWHTAFGLDETPWSLPHAMLGWAWLVTLLGFLAARLELRPYRPLRWYTSLALGVLLLGFSLAPFFGPMRTATTLEVVQARAAAVQALPALASEPGISRVLQIETQWNLTRTSPLYALLGALWVGFSLTLLSRLDPRGWLLLLTVAVWSCLAVIGERREAMQLARFVPHVAGDPAAWLPPPLLPAAIAFVLARAAGAGWGTWAAGVTWAGASVLIWPPGAIAVPVVLLAIPVAAVGAAAGRRVAGVLEAPTPRALAALVLGLGVAAPTLTGLADLYLRAHTP
jgi:hypothetical protein